MFFKLRITIKGNNITIPIILLNSIDRTKFNDMAPPIKKVILTIFMLSLSNVSIYAQNPVDTLKVRALIDKCAKLRKRAPDSLLIYATEGYELAQKIGYTQGTARMLNYMGFYYGEKGEPYLAIAKHKEALELFRTIDDQDSYAGVFQNLGGVYNKLGEYPTAIEFILKAISHYDSTHNYKNLGLSYNSLGILYEGTKNLPEALKAYQTAYYCAKKANQHRSMAGYLINIGNIYHKLDSLPLALNALKYSLNFMDSIGDLKAQVPCNVNLSEVMLDLHKEDSALYYAKRALMLSKSIKNVNGEAYSFQTLARVHAAKKNYSLSREFYKKAITLAKAIHQNQILLESYKELADMESTLGLFAESIKHFLQYDSLRNSIFNEESEQKLANLRIAFDIERKEREIDLLKKDQEISKLNRQLLIIAICSLVVMLGLVIARQYLKIKREAMLRRQQLQLHMANKKLLETELQNKELKEKELEQELEFRDKELASRALNLIQKNEILEEVKEKLKTLDKNILVENHLQIQELVRNIQSSFRQDKEWEGFMEHFMKVNNGFFSQLNARFPDLTGNDLRLCSLIKLNLENKQMASILGISPESIKVSRHRLRKRLGLDSDQNLSAFLTSLEFHSILDHQTNQN